MEKFLTKVAKHILVKHGNNLSGITVLMPNHRSCVYFREALKAKAGEHIWTPEITTLKDWIFERSNLILIEPLEQVLELYDVYREKEGEETFDASMLGEAAEVVQERISDDELILIKK